MSYSTDQQFDEANAAITLAVTQFVSEINSMFGKWEAVAPSYIVENVLIELCTEVPKLADDLKDILEPGTLKRCSMRWTNTGTSRLIQSDCRV